MKIHYTTDTVNMTDEGLFMGVLQLDGYRIADRMLEGVIFLINVKDGVIDSDSVRVRPGDADYFSDFNEAKWLKAAKEAFLQEEDDFAVYNTSIEDIYVVFPVFEDKEKPAARTPVEIELTSGDDLLKELMKGD